MHLISVCIYLVYEFESKKENKKWKDGALYALEPCVVLSQKSELVVRQTINIP